jgi:hypothetical protein
MAKTGSLFQREKSSAIVGKSVPMEKVLCNCREVCSNGKSPLQLSGNLFQRKKSPAIVGKSVPTEKRQIQLSGSLFQRKKFSTTTGFA